MLCLFVWSNYKPHLVYAFNTNQPQHLMLQVGLMLGRTAWKKYMHGLIDRSQNPQCVAG